MATQITKGSDPSDDDRGMIDPPVADFQRGELEAKSNEAPEQALRQFGRYQIIKRLGRGGMGSVYLAQDTHLERPVAIKLPDFAQPDAPDARTRFLEEARAAATLHHPYLCPVFDAGEIDGRPYLTMAYIEGQSLAALIGNEIWPQRQVAALVGKLALALQEAHSQKVVHRDLKPANIMIRITGQRREPVIVDFGLARRENPQEQRLTKSGQVMGTLGYMAPEQIRGDLNEIGPACDIYALGVILYELLTGRLPFGGSGLAVAGQILTEPPLPPSTHRSDLDRALEAICLKAMAKPIGDRYGSMAELAAALTGFLQKPPAGATLEGSTESPDLALPASDEQRHPARSSSLVADFLAQLAENQQTNSTVATLQPNARQPQLPRRRWSAWATVSAASVLGPVFVILMSLVTTDKRQVRSGTEAPSDSLEARTKSTDAPQFGPVVRPGKNLSEKNQPIKPHDSEAEKLDGPEKLAQQDPIDTAKLAGEDRTAQRDPVEKEKPALVVPPPSDSPAEPLEKNSPSPKLHVAAIGNTFRPLFNGKSLDGWKPDPKQPNNWRVVNGILVGSGPSMSHLYTERDDFKDFHLRIEARFNEGGSGAVYVRCPFGATLPADDPKWPGGGEITINNARLVRGSTGGIYPGVAKKVFHTNFTTIHAGQWFTLEAIADGNGFTTLVNGKSSGYHLSHRKVISSSGHLALQQYSPETKIEFRKIEIKELNRPNQKNPREVGRTPDRSGRVNPVVFLPDNQRILLGVSHSELWRVPGNRTDFYSPDPYGLSLCETTTNRDLFAMPGKGLWVAALALSSDGRYAATSAGLISELPLLIWDLASGRCAHEFSPKPMKRQLWCMAVSFSADNRRIMAAAKDGTVLTWDLASEHEQPSTVLQDGSSKVREFLCAVFMPDRQHLITGRQTGLIEVWDLKTGRALKRWTGHTGEVHHIACSADGRRILSAGSDNTLRFWSATTGKELRQLKSDGSHIHCVAFSPDGRRALSGDVYGILRLWDLESGREVCRMEGHTMCVNSVAFSPDGLRAVSGGDDRAVRIWQLPQ